MPIVEQGGGRRRLSVPEQKRQDRRLYEWARKKHRPLAVEKQPDHPSPFINSLEGIVEESVIKKIVEFQQRLSQQNYEGTFLTWLTENPQSLSSFSRLTRIPMQEAKRLSEFYQLPLLSKRERLLKLWQDENYRTQMHEANFNRTQRTRQKRARDGVPTKLFDRLRNGNMGASVDEIASHAAPEKPNNPLIFHDRKSNKLESFTEGGKEIIEQIIANKDSLNPLLITDPEGASKDIIAGALHYTSFRKESPFIHTECRETSPFLWEESFNTYFQEGIFKNVADGTLYLDELSAIPLTIQTRLINFLRRSRRHPNERGGMQELPPFRGRVIVGTNRELSDPSLREYIFTLCTVSEFIKVQP